MLKRNMYPSVKEGIILHLQPKEYYIYHREISSYVERINAVAAEIFKLCNGKYTIDKICKIMAERYKDDLEKVKSMAYPFLQEAETKGHIRFSEIPTSQSEYITGSEEYWIPTTVLFEITRRCVLNCKHCYVSKEPTDEFTTIELLKIIEEFSRLGVMHLFITGGEPLLHPGFFEIVEFSLQKKFVAIEVATSGYMIDEDLAEKISQYKISVQISIDGTKEIHNFIRGKEDAFEKTIKAISLLAERGIPVTVAATVSSVNLKEIENIAKISKNSGAISVRLGYIFPIGRAKEVGWSLNESDVKEANVMLEEIGEKYSDDNFHVADWKGAGVESNDLLEKDEERINCGAGYTLWSITSNGIVVPCFPFDIPLGNLTKNSVEEIARSPQVNFFQNLPCPNEKMCGRCEKFYMCSFCYVGGYINSAEVTSCKWRELLKDYPKII